MALPRWRFLLARRVLRSGGVVAYPTEGVWGLGCDPDNADAVARILEIKKRSWTQGLILVASDLGQLEPYLEGLTETERAPLGNWPVGATCLVPDNGEAPDWIVGDNETLAVRVTRHPVAAALCQALGGPVVSTSANPHGHPSARTALRVRQYFKVGRRGSIDHLFAGQLGGARGASEIRELLTGNIVRAG